MATGWPDYRYPTLDFDLIAQTLSTLSIDLVAQTINSLSVDIIAQTLTELISRYRYGAPLGILWAAAPLENTPVVVLSITGEGICYGFSLRFAHGTQIENSVMEITIDGSVILSTTFITMVASGLEYAHDGTIKMVSYDGTNHIAYVHGMKKLTFNTSLSITVLNVYAVAASCRGHIVYSLA